MSDNVSDVKIHCIGIGGEGVGTLGMLMAQLGLEVTGSDINLSLTQKNNLLKAQIRKIYDNHACENIGNSTAVVFGSAIPHDNCEILEAKRLGVALIPRAKLLGSISRSFKNRAAIVGTHGKSSTTMFFTQLTAELLGVSAHSLLGGQCHQFEFLSYNPGKGAGIEWLIAEVTETDRDFGDFQADLVLCPALSWDHFDQYPTSELYINEFLNFFSSQPKSTVVVHYTESPEIISRLKSLTCRAICIGQFIDNDYIFESLTPYSFDLYENKSGHKKLLLTFSRCSFPGTHYSKNLAVAIVGIIERYNWHPTTIEYTFNPWKLYRRFSIETIGHRSIIFDNAHHWEAIQENLEVINTLYPQQKTAIIFRPSHGFFPENYAKALAKFDYIYISEDIENAESAVWCNKMSHTLNNMGRTYVIFPENLILQHVESIDDSAVIFVAGARAQPLLRQIFNYGDPSG